MTITASTPWREIPTITLPKLTQILAGTPLAPDTLAIYAVIRGRALPIAQAWMESRYGQDTKPLKNALGIMQDDGHSLKTYPSWADGFRDWMPRLTDPGFKGGVYANIGMSLEEYITTYVGGPRCWSTRGRICANGETWTSCQHYLSETINRLNRYLASPSAPPPPPTDTGGPSPVTFGRVPRPAVQTRLIQASTAWNNLGARTVRGVVYHRMLGSLWGTDSYFRTGALNSALTDFGVDAQSGETLCWNDPHGSRAPWASGPWNGVAGDGGDFVARYGVNAINRDLLSIEVSGNYDDTVSEAARSQIAHLSAYYADQAHIPWSSYPKNPQTGLVFTYWHNEFCGQGYKPCPGAVMMALTPDLIARTKQVLKQYQVTE